MKKFIALAIFLVAGLVRTPTARADDYAYATLNGGDFGLLDLSNGAFTLRGNSGQTLAGLGVSGGTLFTANFNSSLGTLYKVNPATGGVSAVGNSGINYDDFGSTTTGLYAVGSDANLYSINSVNGSATLIGSTTLSLSGIRVLSTNASALYFSLGSNLYTLNTGTGAATLVGNTGTSGFGGMVFESGKLYGGEYFATAHVDVINPTTGATVIGSAIMGNSNGVYGLAPAPEPATVVFLVGGFIALLAMRRRLAAANR